MNWSDLFKYAQIVIAPLVLAMYIMVSAYVFRFGLPKSGIAGDYIFLTIVVVLVCALGGIF